ncbi:putative laccase-5 [Vitis vinifera]|uniref:laccase n=1 Tax=Vitis vinifera TaxID=29760 RepID=A0A438H1G6_VITVI|nr:putative laccase-5 [Vitis vinifera]
MELLKKKVLLELHVALLLNVLILCMAREHVPSVNWVEETWYTRLCSSQKILTVNGLFPGPALYMHKGDRLKVNVRNQGKLSKLVEDYLIGSASHEKCNVWLGKRRANVSLVGNFTYEIILSTEEGTLWWHTHSDCSRTTVHGPIIILPKIGTTIHSPSLTQKFLSFLVRSFSHAQNLTMAIASMRSGGDPKTADAFTINGQPGDLYNCSKEGTFRMTVDHGRTYLLRIINSIMNDEMFFMVAHHNLIVVGIHGPYIKPIRTSYIMIIPGQTMDVLIKANQSPSQYYMASRAYAGVVYGNTTTTAILQYSGNYTAPSTLLFPNLPNFTDIDSATNFTERLARTIQGTKVRILEYNSTVEIVFQGTNVLNGAENHPVHLHGYSFYVVGSGFGNFNNGTDPKNYNLVDPPELNTVGVSKNGWAAIRFRADNPGVWFLHCHLEQHSTWGMDTVLIVKNGKTPLTSFQQPPHYLNPC